MKRAWGWAAVTVVGLLLLVAALAAFAPVSLKATSGVPKDQVVAGLWEQRGQTVPTVLRLKAIEEPATVTVTLESPAVFTDSLVTSAQVRLPDGSYLVQPREPLVIEGVFADVTIASSPGSGTVAVSRGTERTLLEEATTITVASPESRYLRSTSMLWRALPTGLASGTEGLTVSVANTEIDVLDSARVTVGEMAPAAIRTVLGGLLAFLAAALLVVFAWLFGRAVDPVQTGGLRREYTRIAIGICLALLSLNTLSYFLPVRFGAPLTALIMATAVAIRSWRSPMRGMGDSARGMGPLLALAMAPAAVAFFPVLLWGATYVGEYKTDVFEYGALAAIARDHSLLSMHTLPFAQQAGTLTSGAGFSWRTIDSLSVSGLSTLGLSTMTSMVIINILLFLVFALGALTIARTAGNGRSGYAVGTLILLAPAYSELFVEGYFSQYFLMTFVPALVITSWLALETTTNSRTWRPGYLGWALASVMATMGAVYPYFTAVMVVGLVIAVCVNRQRLVTAIRMVPALALQVLVLMNLSLLTVVNYAQTQRYQAGLNEIARNVLLSGFSATDRVSLFLGFEPYQWRYDQWPATQAMGFPGKLVWTLSASAAGHNLLEMAVAGFLLVVALIALRWRSSLSSFAFTSLLSMIVIWLLFALYLGLQDSPYASFKATWTAAVLIPLLIAAGAWRPRMVPVLLLALSLTAALWLRTVVADRAAWVTPRDAEATSASHQSLQTEIDALRALLSPQDSVEIRLGAEPLAGSDKDRVALAHTVIVNLDRGTDCRNCRFGSVEQELACELHPDGDVPDVIVTIGSSGRQELCGRSLVFDGKVIEAYR